MPHKNLRAKTSASEHTSTKKGEAAKSLLFCKYLYNECISYRKTI